MHTSKILSTTIFTSQMTFLTLILLLISSPYASSSSSSSTSPFKRIFAFGDSYTDTGNTKTSTGPTAFNHVSDPPYGMTFFHHPTNRYSDGRIVLDFVAQTLALPFVPPYRNPSASRAHGVNFAVGGATAIRHGFFLKNNITFNIVPQSLQTQLVWFNKVMESEGCQNSQTTPRECKAALGDALIWLGEIGANDYTSSTGSSLSRKTIQALALNSVSGFLQALINKGAKYIVVQGLPPTGCITYSFALSSGADRDALGCVATTNRLTGAHNAALQARLAALRRQNPRSIILYADYFNSHLKLLQNAPKLGFKERYKACCGFGGGAYNFDVFNTCGSSPAAAACADPAAYVNWDGAHFTEAAYKVIADSFLNGSFCSPPFHYLMKKKVELN